MASPKGKKASSVDDSGVLADDSVDLLALFGMDSVVDGGFLQHVQLWNELHPRVFQHSHTPSFSRADEKEVMLPPRVPPSSDKNAKPSSAQTSLSSAQTSLCYSYADFTFRGSCNALPYCSLAGVPASLAIDAGLDAIAPVQEQQEQNDKSTLFYAARQQIPRSATIPKSKPGFEKVLQEVIAANRIPTRAAPAAAASMESRANSRAPTTLGRKRVAPK